ncbi:MAG: bifunctional enoyl-CoA hydratase/phosphate acetyltransferase [Betaproteobacteria bacterium]
MMTDFHNHPYDAIAIGESETATRSISATEVEGLAMAAGEVDPFHLEGSNPARGEALAAPGAAAIAMISGMLLRRLPGPGSQIVATQFHYAGTLGAGDTLTATVTAKTKHDRGHRIDFACRCVNQRGETLVEGVATVAAPTALVKYSNVATPEVILRRNDGFTRLLAQCQGLPPVTCAIVHPCDRDSLLGPIEAARRGLIIPVLVGPEAKIRAVAKAEGADIAPYRIVGTEHSAAAADRAVAMARAGEVESLMKGSLHTDELMGAVVSSATGLRTARRISHVYVMDVPAYPKLLLVTDAAVNIFPDLQQKVDIVQNAIELARVLGIDKPKVAILSAVETINPKIQSTLDAAALCKMSDRGQISGGILDGPLAFDNAISAEAARAKKIVSPVAGHADILLVPDLEAGNMLAKQLQYLAGADAAGIVVGARVPIVLTSRADSIRTRLASIAVLKLLAHSRRPQGPKGD